MKRLVWIYPLGLLASLLIWALPSKLKPYHLHRDFEDYKILFVEHDIEYGLAANGLLYVHVSQAYGGTRTALVPVRQEWVEKGSRVRSRFPTGSMRPHYDEWGPSHYTRDGGIEVTQVGEVVCIPYSIVALAFAAGWLASCRLFRVAFFKFGTSVQN